jgi:hypothetical protein
MRSIISLTGFVLASFLLVFSIVKDVKAGDVEFKITDTISRAGQRICWICTGPYARSTGLHFFTVPFTQRHFYTASDGVGSQYGGWTCYWNLANDKLEERVCRGPKSEFVVDFSFNLDKNAVSVEFVQRPGGWETIQTTRTAPARNVSAEATAPNEFSVPSSLGDDSREDKPDRDTFTFDAVEGDAIVLRLVGDPAKGHIGSLARLRLRRLGAASGEEVVEGSVPLKLETTISETGLYEVVVEQDVKQKDDWYRGDYFLVLRPGIAELIPGEDVEF